MQFIHSFLKIEVNRDIYMRFESPNIGGRRYSSRYLKLGVYFIAFDRFLKKKPVEFYTSSDIIAKSESMYQTESHALGQRFCCSQYYFFHFQYRCCENKIRNSNFCISSKVAVIEKMTVFTRCLRKLAIHRTHLSKRII